MLGPSAISLDMVWNMSEGTIIKASFGNTIKGLDMVVGAPQLVCVEARGQLARVIPTDA